MPLMTGPRRAVIGTAGILLALAVLAPVHAADTGAAVENLKRRALDLAVAADLARREQSCPLPGRAELYFGGAAQARAFRLSLVIDGIPLDHDFSKTEAQALGAGGWFYFDCLSLTPGVHHLQVTLDRGEDGDQHPLQAVQWTRDFDFVPGTVLELRSGGGPAGGSLELSARSGVAYQSGSGWRARLGLGHIGLGGSEESGSRFLLGGSGDPRVRRARFLLDTGHAMSAAMVLRELAQDAQVTLAPGFPLALARAELAYGLSEDAEGKWRSAPGVESSREQRAALGLALARYRYRRGEPAAAQDILGVPAAPRGPRPDPALIERQDLYSLLLLAQGRPAEAMAVLRETYNAADYASWVRYYNFGVCLIRNGLAPQGVTVLNRVGSLGDDSLMVRGLRDHANLLLARHFLEDGQGATAIPLFGRIDSEGPDSASALLGLGWAWLAPAGTLQPEIALGDEVVTGPPPETLNGRIADPGNQNLYQRFDLAPFNRASVPSDEALRLRRALVAWEAAADRSSPDEEAEEAMIDIAWALRQLGEEQGAARYDERALAALERDRSVLDAAETQARDGNGPDLWLAGDKAVEPGLPWVLPALPPSPAGPYLLDLLASNPFQAAMHDYRDLRLLRQGLGDGTDAAALRGELDAALQAQRMLLGELRIEALEVHRRRVEALLLDARNAMSRVYDDTRAKAPVRR